jgi:hypothetical protein
MLVDNHAKSTSHWAGRPLRTWRTDLSHVPAVQSSRPDGGSMHQRPGTIFWIKLRIRLPIRLRIHRHGSKCDTMRQLRPDGCLFRQRCRNDESRVQNAALVVSLRLYGSCQRRRRDSNPRYREAVHRFSRPALSTTQAPLRHFGDSPDSLRKARRSWKNSLSTSPHSSARTPEVIGTRWLSRGSETRRYRLSQAPALGSVAP